MAASQMGLRMVFESSKKLVNQLGYDTSHAVVTQSFLRSDIYLNTNSASYSVPILVNQISAGVVSPVRNTLLNLQDLFVCSELQILVGTGNAASAAAQTFSYPSLAAFTAAQGANLNALYNGKLSIISNNSQIVPSWDLLKHYFVPQTQATTTAWDGGVENIDQVDKSSDSCFPIEPNFVINGAANYQISLNLPSAPATLAADTFVSVIFRGCLLQNTTSIK